MRIAVIGEGVIDRFVTSDGYIDVIGGSGLNTAISARLAGNDVHWFSLHSSDSSGQNIRDFASSYSVLPESIRVLDFPTPLVEIALNSRGIPSYKFHLQNAVDWQWEPKYLELLSHYDLLHLTSLSAVLEPGADTIYEYLLRKPSSLLTTFDPNIRPSALAPGKEKFAKHRIEEIVQIVDIVKVSQEDLEWQSNEDAFQTARRWSRMGPTYVILTLGKAGIRLFAKGEELIYIPGIDVEVVDTVGAGDTVMGWVLRSLSKFSGVTPSEKFISDLELAVKAAAITCSRQGCKPPTESEVFES